ncbi:heat-shock protein [Mesorhizobium loti]|nr:MULTISPECIES: Hsp20/alpha crystallin family protein [Mesorhizobium]OBQ77043.1 heat-shock protein [Mesorhizobium loti]BCH00293.1 heat-shock protein Hsp20 [Mesorhizobium sp. 131-2-5]BCH07980.1 heat-shock protein Hsp20 [Mesorhizobium sp. 131-3-5]
MIARTLFGADPFRNIRRLQDEVSRLEFPAVNAFVNQDGVIITAELPGVRSEDLDILIHRDSVTLSGERQTEADDARRAYHRRERRQGRFARTVSLPFVVDPNKVGADLLNGLLTLDLPRAEEDKPKRIHVKASKEAGHG